MLTTLLTELERKGEQNDRLQSSKEQRYLNITRDTGEFLRVLVKATAARRVLEIGTSNGYSALWLASSLPSGGHLTTIELLPAKAEEAQRHFERAGLAGCITLLQGEAGTLLAPLPAGFDLIFLDADRARYVAMLDELLRLLRPGGLLVCDNAVSHRQELEAFVAALNARDELSLSLVPVGKGELLVHKGE